VSLTGEERHELSQLISKGKGAARKQLHARILLKADEGRRSRGMARRSHP